MLKTIIKRSGEKVPFDASKIRGAIFKANVRNATEKMSDTQLDQLTQAVVAELEKLAEQLCRKEVVIATETGCGVVPIDAAEREAREAAGRRSILLAKRAQKVIRVWCGLPESLR